MFILAPKPTVVWPVHFNEPKDGGGFETHTFNVRFNLPTSQEEVESLYQRIGASRQQLLQQLVAKDVAEPADLAAADRHIVETYWAGWPDGELKDPQGAVIPYTPEARAALLAIPGMRAALVRAFLATQGGAAETKNSRPLPTTG